MMPVVAAEPPADWPPAAVAPPRLADGTGAELTSFRASGGRDGGTLVSGCVAVPIPGWVDDMKPAVEARTTALLGAATERVIGAPVDARPDGAGQLTLRAASDLGGPPIGVGRTFLGFDDRRVFSCFVSCAAERGAPSPLGCEGAVSGARLVGSHPPPPPGIALRAVTWGVHNPRPTAAAGGLLVVAAGVVAVVARRKPRSA